MSGVRAAVMTAPGRIEIEEFPRPRVEPGAVLMRVTYSGRLRHRQAHLPGRDQAVRGHAARAATRVPADLRARERRRRGGDRRREVLDSDGPPAASRATGSSRRQRCLRRVLVLPERVPVLRLRAPGGLRQQPERGASAAPVRRLGRAHVPAAGNPALPRPGRAAGRGRGPDRGDVGHPRARQRAGAASASARAGSAGWS